MKERFSSSILIFLAAASVRTATAMPRTDILDSLRVSLAAKDLPLREALQRLVSQTKVQLVYPDALVEGIRSNCSLQNVTLRRALEEILAPAELSFRVMADEQIVIVWRGWWENAPPHRGPPGGMGFGPPPWGRGGPPLGEAEFMDTVLKDLKLSEAQKAEIDTIRSVQQEKALELFHKRQKHELSFESMRAARRAVHEETLQLMKEVLTPGQIPQFEKALKAMRPPRGGMPPPHPEGGALPPRP